MIRVLDLMKERTCLPLQLTIAGGTGLAFRQRGCPLSDIKSQDDVWVIGFVPDDDMPTLYSTSELFLFATLYEGFGVPVIEAQRCGVPVVTSNLSSLPEVAGDGTMFANLCDVESISQAM